MERVPMRRGLPDWSRTAALLAGGPAIAALALIALPVPERICGQLDDLVTCADIFGSGAPTSALVAGGLAVVALAWAVATLRGIRDLGMPLSLAVSVAAGGLAIGWTIEDSVGERRILATAGPAQVIPGDPLAGVLSAIAIGAACLGVMLVVALVDARRLP